MKLKNSFIMALALLLFVLPTAAYANWDIQMDIVNKANTVESSVTNLLEFKNPLKIVIVKKDNSKENVEAKFVEGIRNANDRTAVSVRDFVNVIGNAEIEWNEDHRMVYIKSVKGKEIILPVDKKVIFVDGQMSSTEVPATIDAEIGRTFLPLRTIATLLEYDVSYQPEAHSAILVEPNYDFVGDKKEDVPTLQELLDPVNDMFTGKDKNQTTPTPTEEPKPTVEVKTTSKTVTTLSGNKTEEFDENFSTKLIEAINEYRKSNSMPSLNKSDDLKEISEIRASEFKETGKQTRPDGSTYQSAGKTDGELLAVVGTINDPVAYTMDKFTSDPNYKDLLLNSDIKSFNISAVYEGGIHHLAIEFQY